MAKFSSLSAMFSPSGRAKGVVQSFVPAAQNTATAAAAIFSSPGTYYWTVPTGVYSVCIVCVGGGGGGAKGGPLYGQFSYNGEVAPGGGGGGLIWANNIGVTPGATYEVVVGAGGTAANGSGSFGWRGGDGGSSYFISPTILCATGGTAGREYIVATSTFQPGQGGFGASTLGSQTGQQLGVFVGGAGGYATYANIGNGGGGAAGYTGAGGAGNPNGNSGYGVASTGGGGGGGGGSGAQAPAGGAGGGGGGVGLFGVGSNGSFGFANQVAAGGGSGGGNGGAGQSSSGTSIAGAGGQFGGGAGSTCYMTGGETAAAGGSGGVRIIWGNSSVTRAFPSTNTT